MKRVVVGMVCVLAVSQMAWAYGPDDGEYSGGLLDLVFEVATAPVAILGELSGQGATPYGYRGDYPEECIPADCVPPRRSSRTSHYQDSPYGVPATAYGSSRTGDPYYDCPPAPPQTRRVSRRVQRSSDCPDCPPSRQVLKKKSRTKKGRPRTIIVRVETKKKPAPPKEIIVTVETDKNKASTKDPVVRVETLPKQPPGKEAVVKVEAEPRQASSKETIVRVEITQESATDPKPRKKKRSRRYKGCVPYGAPYWWVPGSTR